MGRENRYFKVGGLRFLQALTPQERYSRFIVTNPSGPLSRHRERGWGERADTPVATLGAILCAVRIDFGLPSKINPYPAQPATGVLGQRPKRVLVPFTRVKGTPRRVGVLIKSIIRLAPPEVITDFLTSAPVRRTKTPPTIPAGGAVFAYVISSSRTARALHRWCAGYGAPGGCPARPNTPRTAPSPRGSRGSCAGSWPHLRYTGPPRARNADR